MYEPIIDSVVEILKFFSAVSLFSYTALPAGLPARTDKDFAKQREQRLGRAKWLLFLTLALPVIVITVYFIADMVRKGFTTDSSVAGIIAAMFCAIACYLPYIIGKEHEPSPNAGNQEGSAAPARRFLKAFFFSTPIDMSPDEIFISRMVMASILILTFSIEFVKKLINVFG